MLDHSFAPSMVVLMMCGVSASACGMSCMARLSVIAKRLLQFDEAEGSARPKGARGPRPGPWSRYRPSACSRDAIRAPPPPSARNTSAVVSPNTTWAEKSLTSVRAPFSRRDRCTSRAVCENGRVESAGERFEVRSGPWGRPVIEEYLRSTTIPVRLATGGPDWPLVQSLWFLYSDSALWCCTQDEAVVASRLRRDPRCAFEVAADHPPYRGVRGRGVATLEPDRAPEVLDRLIERYIDEGNSSLAAWLRSRIATETAIRVGELRVTSWDYSSRM
jgi:hypothetical protein